MKSIPLRLLASIAALAVVAAACGDDDASADDVSPITEASDDTDATGDDDAGTTDGGTTAEAAAIDGTSNLEIVCTDGDGVPGAAAYVRAEDGVPTILFRSRGDNRYQWESRLRGEWGVNLDTLGDVQLVGCLDETGSRATGEMCEGEASGEPEEFEMFAIAYDLTVHEANTAEVVGTASFEAEEPKCPIVATIDRDTGGIRLTPTSDELEAAMIEALG